MRFSTRKGPRKRPAIALRWSTSAAEDCRGPTGLAMTACLSSRAPKGRGDPRAWRLLRGATAPLAMTEKAAPPRNDRKGNGPPNDYYRSSRAPNVRGELRACEAPQRLRPQGVAYEMIEHLMRDGANRTYYSRDIATHGSLSTR